MGVGWVGGGALLGAGAWCRCKRALQYGPRQVVLRAVGSEDPLACVLVRAGGGGTAAWAACKQEKGKAVEVGLGLVDPSQAAGAVPASPATRHTCAMVGPVPAAPAVPAACSGTPAAAATLLLRSWLCTG